MLLLYAQMITSLKLGFATQNRSEPDKSSWNQLQLHLLFFGQTQLFSSHLLDVRVGREGRQEEVQVCVSSPWPPTAQLGWVQRLWEVFLSLINTRVFSLQWEIQHYRLVVLLVPSLVHFWVWSCFCKRLLQWSIQENTIFVPSSCFTLGWRVYQQQHLKRTWILVCLTPSCNFNLFYLSYFHDI